MAANIPTLEASGSQTATISTEHSLLTSSTGGHFELHVDVVNMALGDVLELRLKTKLLTGDAARKTARMVQRRDASGADDSYTIVVVLASDLVVEATLKQTSGTGRVFNWKVLSF